MEQAKGDRVAEKSSVSAETMVHLKGVIKYFGTITALRGIDLELKRGCCLGIFGPNGAGKTTLFRMIVGQEKNSRYPGTAFRRDCTHRWL